MCRPAKLHLGPQYAWPRKHDTQTVNIVPHSRHLISRPTISEHANFLATLVALGDRRDVYASERDTKAGRSNDSGLHSFWRPKILTHHRPRGELLGEIGARFLRIGVAV